MKKPFVSILTCMLTACLAAHAGERTVSVSIDFHRSHIDIDTAYADNGRRLDSIINMLSFIPADGRVRHLNEVRVVGAASPEGSVKFNQYLSEKRAQAIVDVFRSHNIISDSTATSHRYLGRDWQGLRRDVLRDGDVPYRADVITLLDKIVDKDSSAKVAHPLAQLKALHNGRPYRYLDSHIFPGLRISRIELDYVDIMHPLIPGSIVPSIVDGYTPAPMPVLADLYIPQVAKEHKPFYMALKSNMIYDALALPNIGAEFYVGRNWSLTGDWIYGWWDTDKAHRYWRLYGGYVGARRWFGKKAAEKPLTGHHLGAFAGAITYDFEFGGEGIMGGKPHGTLWDRCNVIAGIEYGYSLPVGRRVNIDFSIAFGYIGGKYYKYVPYNGFYMWQSTHRLNYVGPTKIEVSLVWLIGRGNYNQRRAGR